jgi:hypothetical protein
MRRPGRSGSRQGRLFVALAAGIGIASASLSVPASAAGTPLVGTFTVTPGTCSGGVASGTYLRMVLSGGTNAAGPYFSNSDSSCSDNTYTPLSPGSDGGLVTGTYQPQPTPAFDSSGNALAALITMPVPFEGVKFATATNPVDPQTGLHTPPPSVLDNGGTLSGNLQSFGVSWNNQEFNQGSPKPDGSSPGNTTPVTGTYNATTGAYVLQWSSQVVGGPFNGFSAFWNLTGRFIPSTGTAATAASSGSAAATSSGASPGATPTATAGSAVPAGSSPSARTSSGSATTGLGAGDSADGGATSTASATPASAGPATSPTTRARTIESSHTIVTGPSGWDAPIWLVVLVAVLGALGLAGVLWAERHLRRLRPIDHIEVKGT